MAVKKGCEIVSIVLVTYTCSRPTFGFLLP